MEGWKEAPTLRAPLVGWKDGGLATPLPGGNTQAKTLPIFR